MKLAVLCIVLCVFPYHNTLVWSLLLTWYTCLSNVQYVRSAPSGHSWIVFWTDVLVVRLLCLLKAVGLWQSQEQRHNRKLTVSMPGTWSTCPIATVFSTWSPMWCDTYMYFTLSYTTLDCSVYCGSRGLDQVSGRSALLHPNTRLNMPLSCIYLSFKLSYLSVEHSLGLIMYLDIMPQYEVVDLRGFQEDTRWKQFSLKLTVEIVKVYLFSQCYFIIACVRVQIFDLHWGNSIHIIASKEEYLECYSTALHVSVKGTLTCSAVHFVLLQTLKSFLFYLCSWNLPAGGFSLKTTIM